MKVRARLTGKEQRVGINSLNPLCLPPLISFWSSLLACPKKKAESMVTIDVRHTDQLLGSDEVEKAGQWIWMGNKGCPAQGTKT